MINNRNKNAPLCGVCETVRTNNPSRICSVCTVKLRTKPRSLCLKCGKVETSHDSGVCTDCDRYERYYAARKPRCTSCKTQPCWRNTSLCRKCQFKADSSEFLAIAEPIISAGGTQVEVARVIGISKERVRQLLNLYPNCHHLRFRELHGFKVKEK